MSLANIFKISSQGMTAQRERLEAAAANLANANTTRTPEGVPYRRRDTVFEAIAIEKPNTTFGAVFDKSFDNSLSDDAPEGVQATTRLAEVGEFVRRYQPGHPDADA